MADKLNTVYTDSTGTSSFWDFQDALQSYGVYSSYTGNLVADTLRVNLLNGLPIIMRGARITPSGESGHFFLVDGYVRYRIVTTSVYVMVWDPPRPINLDGDFIEINYSTPTIELVKMNWGWGDCSHKDDSYSPYGTWEAADGYVYDRGYKMLSGYYLDD